MPEGSEGLKAWMVGVGDAPRELPITSPPPPQPPHPQARPQKQPVCPSPRSLSLFFFFSLSLSGSLLCSPWGEGPAPRDPRWKRGGIGIYVIKPFSVKPSPDSSPWFDSKG